jgi:uncharacterized protein (DUF58 family)
MRFPFGDLAEAELARLGRIASRLLVGTPNLPHGSNPRRRRAGRGIEFFELRGYAAGDAPRDIDWRASARSQRTVVRAYRDEGIPTAWLCVDRSASMSTSGGAKWRLTAQVAGALAYLLVCAGNRVGLLVFSDVTRVVAPPGHGRSAYARLLARLAGVTVSGGGEGSRLDGCARFATRGALIMVLSDFLDPDFLRSGLAALLHRGANVQALQVISHSDAELPTGDDALLRDIESGERRYLRLPAAAAEYAPARLRELTDRLAAYCRGHGVVLTRYAPHDAWRDVVLAHLRSLELLRA